jgi:serine protease AprX
VLSMSLGFNHRPTWSQGGHGWSCPDGRCQLCVAVENAVTLEGVLAVVAAGNEHQRAEFLRSNGSAAEVDSEICCPGASAHALTVAALTKQTFLTAPFSSRGPTAFATAKPDIAALA